MNKKKIGLAVLALALCIGIVSAVFIEFFGQIQTTITLDQSVLLDGQDYTTPIVEALTVYGGYYYGDFHDLDNRANVPVDLMFEALPNTEGIEVQYPTLAHLTAIGEPAGKETRVVIPMPDGTTLGDIETISWLVNTVAGYPPHVDIILADDIDGIANIDSLTAELAVNSNPENLEWNQGTGPHLQDAYTYGKWLKIFELDTGKGDAEINGDTVLWVTRLGAGNKDAPYGTLDELKLGNVIYPTEDPEIMINSEVVVLRLEIEVDNWLGDAEAYIGCIKINGELRAELPVITEIFTLPANEILYFCTEYYVDPNLVPSGDYTVTTFVKPAPA